MLIYRNRRHLKRTAPLLADFRGDAERLAGRKAEHAAVRDLLVGFDELETAIVDARHPREDDETEVEICLGRAARELGRSFVASWEGRSGDARSGLGRLVEEISRLETLALPPMVAAGEAEGYAWYGLFPETYLAAARQFLVATGARNAVCLGIRQIGASLAAVVAATLEEAGCDVRRHTVRPRGDPFDRRFTPSHGFADRLREETENAFFLLIDEGPGLSGSTFCGLAQALADWGVNDERIVFFPAWLPAGHLFRSPAARNRWPRHRKFCIPPERLGLPDLATSLPGHRFLDLSAGRWRYLLLQAEAWPPVQPQHERRKILACPPGHPVPCRIGDWQQLGSDSFALGKFAGFGRQGRLALDRAERLAAAGLTPPPIALVDGFLLTRFIAGQPLTRRQAPRRLLATIARYLALLRTEFPDADSPAADLASMVRHNVRLGLGEDWLTRLGPLSELTADSFASSVDGRMLPQEWLATKTGFFKTDALDHHDDHFYPGPTDIAWDLAACGIEFGLDAEQNGFVQREYERLAGDRDIGRRLPAFRLAWLAFRLGYAAMGAETLGGCADGRRFLVAEGRYRRLLRWEILRG